MIIALQCYLHGSNSSLLYQLPKYINFAHTVSENTEKKRYFYMSIFLFQEARRLVAAEVGQQGIVQRWFPGWMSGYQADPGGETRDSSSLDEVDEEELLDELGLEMDASSHLLKDRIFAMVSFSLKKGTLNLVTEDKADNFGPTSIIELEVFHGIITYCFVKSKNLCFSCQGCLVMLTIVLV